MDASTGMAKSLPVTSTRPANSTGPGLRALKPGARQPPLSPPRGPAEIQQEARAKAPGLRPWPGPWPNAAGAAFPILPRGAHLRRPLSSRGPAGGGPAAAGGRLNAGGTSTGAWELLFTAGIQDTLKMRICTRDEPAKTCSTCPLP